MLFSVWNVYRLKYTLFDYLVSLLYYYKLRGFWLIGSIPFVLVVLRGTLVGNFLVMVHMTSSEILSFSFYSEQVKAKLKNFGHAQRLVRKPCPINFVLLAWPNTCLNVY